MAIESILLYILSGYGVCSLFLIIHLFVRFSKFELEAELERIAFEQKLSFLETRVEKYIVEDARRLSREIERLDQIGKTLIGDVDITIDSASIKMNKSEDDSSASQVNTED